MQREKDYSTRPGCSLEAQARVWYILCNSNAMTLPPMLLKSSRAALGTPDALASVQSVSAFADCAGPRGKYITEIHSARDGRVRFQQTFAGRNSLCIIINGGGAWATDTVTGETHTLDAHSVSMIRGHEFQMLPLTLAERYAAPELTDAAQWNGEMCMRVLARDDLGFPCTHYFQSDIGRWMGMELTNPRQPDTQVRVLVQAWRTIENVALPASVSAVDAHGEYTFYFHTIVLNRAAPEFFMPPRAVAREAHAM